MLTEKQKLAKAKYKARHPDRVRAQSVAHARRYYAANRETIRMRVRLAKYGLTDAELTAMYNAQNGCCPACGRCIFISIPGRAGGRHQNAVHVDHDHVTGAIRGLLCSRCNRTLGMVEDDVSVLRGLETYLGSVSRRRMAHRTAGDAARLSLA